MTKQITKFGKPECSILRNEINAALKAVADKYGIGLEVGNMKFSETTVEIKVQAGVKASSGQVETQESKDFRLYAQFEGFKPEDLGRQFTSRGLTHTIVGYRRKASKAPILTKASDGKQYIFPSDIVKAFLK